MRTSIKILLVTATSFLFAANVSMAQWNLAGNTLTGPPSSPNGWIGTINSSDWIVRTGGTERMRILSTGSFLLNGNTGTTPVSGLGTRMMWIPSKSAFRAGAITSSMLGTNAWDDQYIGIGSTAFGYNTGARGNYSFAVGAINIASGVASFGAGQGNFAPGDNASAFGTGTTAQAYCSFVIGRSNTNPGNYSPTTWVATDPLFVIGNGVNYQSPSNALTVLKNGNTGIGLVSPPSKLSILGGTDKTSGFSINRGDVYTCIYNQPATNAGVIQVYSQGNANTIGNSPYALDLQPEGGNVEIGPHSNNSSYRLSVNGDIRTKRIVVETGWSDFVFERSYELKSLEEVEQYIEQNGHLPGMPSTNEVESNGGDLGQLVKLQMQKIEELTLYIIQQNKRIEAIQNELTALKKGNN